MANIGYIQVVRHCNHFCGFCSNPTTPYIHDLESMRVLVDDLVARDYFGVVMTGGEPTLHANLPEIIAYANERGLHVRMITNGWRLADRSFARELGRAGLRLVHVSIYSVRPEIEASLRGVEGTLGRAFAALDNAAAAGIEVNINSVINRQNADHLDVNVRYFTEHHPQVRHFVWNNLDPSMGRAEVNQERFVPRLADFELSLHRALRHLHRSGRSFRVERVPLCYMTEFAWASTETRKIIKGEERVVHFLDDKQTVRQTAWGHIYADGCGVCSLRSICGGLFDQGGAYDPAELHPVFVDQGAIVGAVLGDPGDPSFNGDMSVAEWRQEFELRGAPSQVPRSRAAMKESGLVPVGRITDRGRRLFAAKRKKEAAQAERLGVAVELGPAGADE